MSWQLGAFAILAVGLFGGFAWYERTKPDARLVALVGTLAAFGALGRIAFAAIPNVKPTGDIVLISGYALGGAPGFIVGAVSALTSNFFFGQGPWTPWQMIGWGVTGVLGAGLAAVTRGRISRWPLAIICFVLGFAFTALQDFGDWINYSDHSLTALGVYLGKGIGFDFIYAAGCLVFALAFGPALIRSLRRFRQRLNVSWLDLGERMPSGDVALLTDASGAATSARRRFPGARLLPVAIVAVMIVAAAATAAPRVARAAPTIANIADSSSQSGPIKYLKQAEHKDGGVGMGPNQSSDTMVSGWTAMALATAPGDGENTAAPSGGQSLVQYLTATIKQERGAGSIERTVLALAAAGANLHDVGGVDLDQQLRATVERNGSVNDQTNLTAFGVLALRAAHLPVPSKTIAWLVKQQDGDGGFNFETGSKMTPSDPDDTGAVLEALAHTGNAKVVAEAVAYLRKQQNRDGGFPDEDGAASDAQSTAFAIQGLIAAGVKLARFHRAGGKTPLEYLKSLVKPDGAINYARGNAQSPVWVTAEAELALAGKALPLQSATAHTTKPATTHTGETSGGQRRSGETASLTALLAAVIAKIEQFFFK